MYTKDLCKRVTLRLDEELSEFITAQSKCLGVTPSQYVRMVLHAYVDCLSSADLTGATNLQPFLSEASSEKAVVSENNSFN